MERIIDKPQDKLQDKAQDIIIENEHLRLIVGGDCITKSLLHKHTGEECLAVGEEVALFSVTQERPFNNEVKLAHPNKRTTFQANRIRREGDKLIVGFEIIPYEVVIEVKEMPMYVSFSLTDFIVHPTDYPGLRMSPPAGCRIAFAAITRAQQGEFW